MTTPTWRRALITGASRGIGEAFARELSARGTDLVLVARSRDELDTHARELEDAHGVTVEVLPSDLTDAAALGRVEERLRTSERPVDLLVNNAGFGSSGPFHEQDLKHETDQLRIHLLATWRLTHATLGRLVDEGRGGVLNVASILSFSPGPHAAVYSASKAAVRSFTEALHEEVRGTGVHVTALCPGFTRTAIFDVAGGDTSAVPSVLWMEPAHVARAGLRAITRNDAVCVPGMIYRAQATTAPRLLGSVRRRIGGFLGRRF